MKYLVAAVLVLLLPGLTFAQGSQEFVDSSNRRYLNRDPKIGSLVPDIQAWDATGNEFQLGSTRGKYTVIIFGCLT